MSRTVQIKEIADQSRIRVDKYLTAKHPIPRTLFSRSDTTIMVNGVKVKKSQKISCGDEILFTYTQEGPVELKPEAIELDKIYEDENILVINKPQGLVVHPAHGHRDGTLVNALLNRYGEHFMDDSEQRPGIVHRLDMDTSGVMVCVRNAEAKRYMTSLFANRTVDKTYICLARGVFTRPSGELITGMARSPYQRQKFAVCDLSEGKRAHTCYRVLKQYEKFALVEVKIYTGRTHQIRVHLSSIGHPIVGDPKYSRHPEHCSLMLHAYKIGFVGQNGEYRVFRAPLPERFKTLIRSDKQAVSPSARG